MASSKKAEIINPLEVKIEPLPLISSKIPSPWNKLFFDLTSPPENLTEARHLFYQLDRLSLAVVALNIWDDRIHLKLGKGYGYFKKQSIARGKLLTQLFRLIEATPLFASFQDGKLFASLDPKGIPMPSTIAFGHVFREREWAGERKITGIANNLTKSGHIERLRHENRQLQGKENPFTSPATKLLFDRAIKLSLDRSGKLKLYQREIFTPFVEARMAYTTLLREKGKALIKVDTINNRREIVKRGRARK